MSQVRANSVVRVQILIHWLGDHPFASFASFRAFRAPKLRAFVPSCLGGERQRVRCTFVCAMHLTGGVLTLEKGGV